MMRRWSVRQFRIIWLVMVIRIVSFLSMFISNFVCVDRSMLFALFTLHFIICYFNFQFVESTTILLQYMYFIACVMLIW